MPLVARQNAIDIQKVSDLKEAVGTKGDITVWMLDGEEFKYVKGEACLRSRTSMDSPWEIWPLNKADKTTAKRRIFELIK